MKGLLSLLAFIAGDALLGRLCVPCWRSAKTAWRQFAAALHCVGLAYFVVASGAGYLVEDDWARPALDGQGVF